MGAVGKSFFFAGAASRGIDTLVALEGSFAEGRLVLTEIATSMQAVVQWTRSPEQ
jgi:hypothetical protein